jgi:inner membrane protein
MNRLVPLFKFASIFFLMLLLLIPMSRIQGLIRERQAARDTVVQDIARSAAYAQTVTGPILIVPYARRISEQQLGADRQLVTITREVAGELRLLPAALDVSGKLGTEERQRGIYRAQIINADTKLSGHFEVPANYGVKEDVAGYRFGEPRLALGITDIRGIGNALTLNSGGSTIEFRPGSGTDLFASGVHAPLKLGDGTPINSTAGQRLEYSVELKLQGTGSFNITPVGRETHVMLTSTWPHPSFEGEFLPRSREINQDGFSAEWQTSFFATNMEEVLDRCQSNTAAAAQSCKEFNARYFGVSFVDPVDQYLKSERATKYAFLFIGLTFGGFILMEVLRRVSVHPVQYGLVGLALALFFLLLLSFSEHIGFASAYAVSATACVGLITFYVLHVLQSRAQGAGFGLALAGLYGLLYGILSSEDYALLMGSLLVFGLLAGVMVLTRRVNWSGFGAGQT